ncbi:alpha/beta fold hydrolase [Actinoplanes sp. GCM10030250]|uniref:alpha/beta fold hydrolase n=1 Tax=Actinoplanes sp. GCM10030250 TaxID=3273376 RepID=UPI00360F3062
MILIGHSSGGIVAWRTALAHPGRVAALILEETPPVPHRMANSSRWAAGTASTPRIRRRSRLRSGLSWSESRPPEERVPAGRRAISGRIKSDIRPGEERYPAG